jgi:hypothetical protein
MRWCAARALPCSLPGLNDRDLDGDGSTRSDLKRASLGPYEKANTSRWNFRCGGAMLTDIPGNMAGGCEWPTAASRYGAAPSSAIATIALVVTVVTYVRAVV